MTRAGDSDRSRSPVARRLLKVCGGLLLALAGVALSGKVLLGQSPDRALFIDPQGRVGIGKVDPSTALDVAGVVTAQSFEGVGAVPKGAILMWSGALDAIPAGWALCDGREGTPDLRDRFVVGAGGKRAARATGGE